MSHLKSKSEFNLEAAYVLIDKYDFFAPSVHCSYYGCFQYIKSKLNQLGVTYDQMDKEIAASRQEGVRTLNSHNHTFKLIYERVRDKSNDIYAKGVKDKIKLLKAFREESDYHNKYIGDKQSRDALDLSKEIIKLINQKL